MPSDDPAKAFATYSHYVEAAATLADLVHASEYHQNGVSIGIMTDERVLRGLLAGIRTSPAWSAIQPRKPNSERGLRVSLQSAWGTELMIGLAHDLLPDETLSLSCQWAAIQAYYAVHQATRAVGFAIGQEKAMSSHQSVQRFFGSVWFGKLGVVPLNARFGPEGPLNLETTSAVHNLSTVSRSTAWPLYAMGLRTTYSRFEEDALREAAFDKARLAKKTWLEEEKNRVAAGKRARKAPSFPRRARLTPPERLEVRQRQRPASLIDLLYRLRIESNYDDATVFYEGAQSNNAAWVFTERLRLVVAVTLAASESLVRRYVGAKRFDPLVEDWVARQKRGRSPRGTLLSRAGLLMS